MSIDFSLILPSYMEEENLRIILPRIKKTLENLSFSCEILIIDTPEPLDRTEEVSKDFGAICVRRGPGSSFGDAVRTGIQAGKGKWFLFMDADGSHSPEFIPKMLAEVSSCDVVIASRYVPGGHTDNSFLLICMSRILNFTYRLVLDLNYKDISNSYKVYRSDWMKELHLKCHNFDIIEEILFKLHRLHPAMKVKEIPFSFKQRMFGETKRNLIKFVFTYLFTIIKLRISI